MREEEEENKEGNLSGRRVRVVLWVVCSLSVAQIIQLPLPTISLIAKQLIFPSLLDSPFVISQLRASGWESCRKTHST